MRPFYRNLEKFAGLAAHVAVALAVAISIVYSSQSAATDTAVIVVDMQTGFVFDTSNSLPQLVAQQLELLEWAKAKGYNVLAFEFKNYGYTLQPLYRAIQSFGPGRYAVVQKEQNNGFDKHNKFIQQAEQVLADWGTKRVIVCGIQGTACVVATASGAVDLNLEVYTAADVIADYDRFEDTYPGTIYDRFFKPPHTDKVRFFQSRVDLQNCEAFLSARSDEVTTDKPQVPPPFDLKSLRRFNLRYLIERLSQRS